MLQSAHRHPTRFQAACRAGVLAYLSRLRDGRLDLVLPDGAGRTVGPPGAAARGLLRVRDDRFFARVALHGDVGFGEAYVDGDWDTDDLPGLLALLAGIDREANSRRAFRLTVLTRWANRLRHLARPNSLPGSRRNIRDHYDLGNAFFEAFLDPSLTYSCAVFEPGDDLAAAQLRKIRTLVDLAGIGPGHHVLEIGSGWGAFAIEAARRTGCRVTSITLSREQQALAEERVRAAGLADRVRIDFADYRQVTGQYDRIVSVEMLEAVGHEHLGTFFRACDERLRPGGAVVLQVITIPDQRYEAYRRGCDWIQKHIFPGGFLPSLTAMSSAMSRRSRLVVDHLRNIGPHYATTLRCWREAFLARRDELSRLGLDTAFQRKWVYYLAYCEAAFATRRLQTLQLRLTRPG